MASVAYYITPEGENWHIRFLLEKSPFTPRSKAYPSCVQALTVALEVAHIDLHYGQDVCVLVEHRDGSSHIEWSGTHMAADDPQANRWN